MRNILKDYILICSLPLFLAMQGCSEKPVIPKEEMTDLLCEFFLADQYIQQTPQMNAQTDSLMVYPAILRQHGYTQEDYIQSVTVLLEEDDTYRKIYEKAKERLKLQVEDLEAELTRRAMDPFKEWWGRNILYHVGPDSAAAYPLIREYRWLVLPADSTAWTMLEDAIEDIPQNAVWWENNMAFPFERFQVAGDNPKDTLAKASSEDALKKSAGKIEDKWIPLEEKDEEEDSSETK